MDQEKIIRFVSKNTELINKAFLSAAKESLRIEGSALSTNEMQISVVLTTDFKIESYSHHTSYNHTTDVLLVLFTFNYETYFPDYEEIIQYMNDDEKDQYNSYVFKEGLSLLKEETDEDIIGEFNSLAKHKKNDFIISYISDQGMLLKFLFGLDSNLHNKVERKIFNSVFDNDVIPQYHNELLQQFDFVV